MNLKGSIFKTRPETRDGQPNPLIASGNIPRVGDQEKVYHNCTIGAERAAKPKADGSPGKPFHRLTLNLPEGEFFGNVFSDSRKYDDGTAILYSGSIKIQDIEHRISVSEARKEGMVYVSIYQAQQKPQQEKAPAEKPAPPKAEPYDDDLPF